MDAAIASIITGILTVFGSVIVAKINNRRKYDECIKHRKELEEKEERMLNSPKHHYFFGKMNYYIQTVIPCIKEIHGVPKIKINMMKKFLNIKYSVFADGMQSWVNRDETVELTDIIKYIMSLIVKYEKQAVDSGIPKIFVDTFAKSHEPYVTSTVQSIEQIMRCEAYSNTDKENSILDILLHAFTMTVFTAEQTCKNMNGELESALLKMENMKEG